MAGWAISSLNRQLPSNEAHSQMTATPEQVQKPLEIPRQASMIFNSTAPSPAATPRASFGEASRPSATSPRLGQGSRFGALSAKSGGMQLGGSSRLRQQHQSEGQSVVDALAAEYEEDEAGSVGDAWGDGDLMDVNADADDWSEYSVRLGKHSTNPQRLLLQAPLKLHQLQWTFPSVKRQRKALMGLGGPLQCRRVLCGHQQCLLVRL